MNPPSTPLAQFFYRVIKESSCPFRKISLFCQHTVDLKLDSHRFIGNNTHELTILPAFRRGSTGRPGTRLSRLLVGLLWLAGSEPFACCLQPKACLLACRIFLGR